MEEEFEEFEEHPQDVMEQYETIRMTTTIDKKSMVWTIQAMQWMQAAIGMHG